MSEHPVDPELVEALELWTGHSVAACRAFVERHRLARLAPGQIVLDGEPAGWMHPNGLLTGSWGMLCSLTREQALPDDVPVYFGPVQEADNE